MYTAVNERYQAMKYRRAGNSGLKLPMLSLGLWHNFGSTSRYDTMRELCFTAFDNGMTHFDLANNYGPPEGAAELNFGRILREDLAAYRDELIVSTKAGYGMWPGPYGDWGSRKYLLSSLDQSLKRLGLEYVDIFYHHRPDPDTPLEETMGALASAVQSGKALYVGLSNYSGARAAQAAAILREQKVPFVLHQNSYSILNRKIEENGLRDCALENGQGVIAFKPLEQGLLTGKYLNGIPADSRVRTDGRFLRESSLEPETLEKIRQLGELAAERGQSLAQMSLAWCLRDQAVTSVLIGASRPAQILENIAALEGPDFTGGELARIDAIVKR